MPLPDSYLSYSERKYGMDQTRFKWDPADRRAPITLSNGARAMGFIVVPLEFFPLNPPAKPFAHPGAMKTPYPDLRHFTTRDYGNRVGVYRILRALDAAGLKATFAVNAEIALRYPPLLKAIIDAGHEIAAHGVSTAHIHHEGLSTEEERSLIDQARAALPGAQTWMSPARNQSYHTPDLLTETGYTICLDWEMDQRPVAMRTENGPLTSLPVMTELDDFKLLIDRRQQEDEWAAQIVEAAAMHVDEHEQYGAQCFGFTLTPHIIGQPFRVKVMADMLKRLADMDGFKIATASDVAAAFADND